MRGPNQIVGKSHAGAVEALRFLCHSHPYREIPDRPIAGRLVPYSDDSSKEIEAKLFALLPAGLLHPDCRYHPDRGFRVGNRRILRLRTGDSMGIVSQSAGTLAAAGATLDFVWLDEPPEQRIFAEAQSRVLVRKGCLWLTLTPVGRPVGWLKDACESGLIEDIHVPPTPENTGMSQEELDEIEQMILPTERPQRYGGEWEGATPDRFYGAWTDAMVSKTLPDCELQIGLGIDHGDFLWGGHNEGTGQRNGLNHGQLSITSARRQVDDQHVELTPVDVMKKLPHSAHDHWTPPDDGFLLGNEKTHGHASHTVGIQWHDLLVLIVHGLAIYVHHGRQAGSIDVCVHQANLKSLL